MAAAWRTPFPPEAVDEIYSRQMLEHLPRATAARAVSHWLCILKPGGRLDVSVPDLRKAVDQLDLPGSSPYVEHDVTHREHGMCSIYGWQTNPQDFHRWGYMEDTLKALLEQTGFADVQRVEDTESRAGPLILRMLARKPGGLEP